VSYVVADPTEPADRALPELESETALFQVVVDTPHLVLLKVRP
jgi:hypothetical protein